MRGENVAKVKRHVLEMVPQPCFMEGANCPRRQPRRHQQNKQAGPLEERAQVQANTAPVEQETEHHGGGKAQQSAYRWPDPHILLECRQQEEN